MVVVEMPPRPRRAYSLIRASAVGKTPPNPRPAMNRRIAKIVGFGANAHNNVRIEKPITVHSMDFRRPMTSLIGPTARAPIITPIKPITEMTDAEVGFNPQPGSFSSEGSTTPRTTRSKPSRATAHQHNGATQPEYRARGLLIRDCVIAIAFRTELTGLRTGTGVGRHAW